LSEIALRIEKISRHHDTSTFDCGEQALNDFLSRFALTNQNADSGITYVACDGDDIIGFYTLVSGAVSHADASDRLKKGLPRHPVPLMILARMAVATARKGEGLGKWLLKDAVKRTLAVADIAGVRALLVHAKNDTVADFYANFGFARSEFDPLHLYVLTKELRKLV
jgi:GNAT superfamily N-acetyltransferase